MSRTYARRTCWLCKEQVSSAGGAFAAHLKKHVREGGELGVRAKTYLDNKRADDMKDYLRRHGVER